VLCSVFRLLCFARGDFSLLLCFFVSRLEKQSDCNFRQKCMQRRGYCFPTCRISLKIFNNLKSIASAKRPMLQWYSIFSLFYLFLFVLICLFHCVFWLSSLCLFEWSALIWSVPSWALVVLEFRAFVFVYFDLVFAFCSNLLCLVSEKMGCIGRKYLCFSMETQFKVHIFLASLWKFILKVQNLGLEDLIFSVELVFLMFVSITPLFGCWEHGGKYWFFLSFVFYASGFVLI